MQWFKSLKLMPKLMVTFGLVLFLLLIQGVVAYVGLHSLNSKTSTLTDSTLPSVRSAGELQAMISEYRNAFYQSLVRSSEQVKEDAKKRKVELRKSIDTTTCLPSSVRYKPGYMPLHPFWQLFKWQEWMLYVVRKLTYDKTGKKR